MTMTDRGYNQLRCAIYARKSSESEDRQALSIESQLGVLHESAKRHEITVSMELTESMSAKEPGRPIFNQMIAMIQRGEIDAILCWKLDRLARNAMDQGTIQYLLQKGTIKRIITSERDYLPEDNVLLMGVELGMANQYIMDLRKNVMRGNKTKLEKGWLPGKPPIGYLNEGRLRTIVPDPERFDLVRKLFQLYLTGAYSPRQLVRIAKEELRLTLPVLSQGAGKDLDKSYIYRILRNPFYCGIIVRKGERYNGAHERMITTIEHEEVLRLVNKKQKSGSSVASEPKSFFPLVGMMRCSCGRMITAYVVKKKNGKKYRYYSCSRKSSNDGEKCPESVVKADDVENRAEQIVNEIVLPRPLAEWIKAWAKYGHKQEVFFTQLEFETLHKERECILKRLQSLTGYLLDGVLGKDEYEREKPKLQDELQKVEVRLACNKERIEEWERAVCDVLDLSVIAKRAYENGSAEDKKLILRAIGSNFVLSGKKLVVEVKKPFQVISNNQIILTTQDEQDLTRMTLQITQNPSQIRDSVNGHPSSCLENGRWCTQDDSNV